jgi:hypothetical protein
MCYELLSNARNHERAILSCQRCSHPAEPQDNFFGHTGHWHHCPVCGNHSIAGCAWLAWDPGFVAEPLSRFEPAVRVRTLETRRKRNPQDVFPGSGHDEVALPAPESSSERSAP